MSTFWLVIKALLTVLPWIVSAVRDGRIKEASQQELAAELRRLADERVDAAVRARNEPHSLPDDPHDRANRG